MLGWNQHLVRIVDDEAVGGAATMRDPCPAPLAHQCIERYRDASGRARPCDAAVLAPDVQIGLAIGDDKQRTRTVSFLFAGAREPASKQHGPDELMNRNECDQDRLQLRSPSRELGCDHRRQADGDPRLRDESGPRVLTNARVNPRDIETDPRAGPDQAGPDSSEYERDGPDGEQYVESKRGANCHEEDHQDRRGATLYRRPQCVALRDGEIFD